MIIASFLFNNHHIRTSFSINRHATFLVLLLCLVTHEAINSALPAQMDRGHRCLSWELYGLRKNGGSPQRCFTTNDYTVDRNLTLDSLEGSCYTMSSMYYDLTRVQVY